MQCFINQSWGACLSHTLKFHVCSCWSPNTTFHALHFPYIWQFISNLPVLFPQECCALIFEVIQIHNCTHIKFLACEWSCSDGHISSRHFYLSRALHPRISHITKVLLSLSKHPQHDTAQTSNSSQQKMVTSVLFSDWTTPKHSKPLSRLQPTSFPHGEILQFFSQNEVYSKGRF